MPDINELVKRILPKFKKFLEAQEKCKERNHFDSKGKQYEQSLLNRSISTRYCNDLMQCQNCKLVYSQNPPYEEIEKLHESLFKRITI